MIPLWLLLAHLLIMGNGARSGRRTTSAYVRGSTKRARADAHDPSQCHHGDLTTLKLEEDSRYFNQREMDLRGVKCRGVVNAVWPHPPACVVFLLLYRCALFVLLGIETFHFL